MPEDMSDRMPEDMPDRMPEDLPDRMPEDMPDHMPEDMPDHMPEDMPDRMPEDLPVRKCINAMVGITRSKVIWAAFFGTWLSASAISTSQKKVTQKKKKKMLAARLAVTRELIPKAELTSRATNFKTLPNEPSC